MRTSRLWENPVAQSVLPVVDGATALRVSEEAIASVAAWMAYEEFPAIGTAPLSPFDVGPERDRITGMTMLINTLNFAFTDFGSGEHYEVDYQGVHYADSEAMVASLHRALRAGVPILDGGWAASVDRAALTELFAGSIEIPMLDERAAVLNEVGAVLVERYGGSWGHWVASCAPALYAHGDGLLERLPEEFPRFRDTSTWNGHTVQIMKLAQLGLWSLHLRLARDGVALVRDPHAATGFADYILPVAFEVMKIFSYAPELSARIAAGTEIPRDSSEEVELRAATIYAVTRLTDEMNLLRPASAQLIAPQVDYRLWKAYHATHRRHHLTRTVMY